MSPAPDRAHRRHSASNVAPSDTDGRNARRTSPRVDRPSWPPTRQEGPGPTAVRSYLTYTRDDRKTLVGQKARPSRVRPAIVGWWNGSVRGDGDIASFRAAVES